MMEKNKIPTIFFGAGNFAVKILENLLNPNSPISETIDIVAVVTQPDKEAGRKKELTPPPVKLFLQNSHVSTERSIPLLQPASLRFESANILEKFKPELIIVADYGQIIPNNIIDFPKYKCLNIHGSILPKYRGAVPAAMAILNGDKTTGVSIPIMTYKLDDGAVIGSKEIDILDSDTTYSLRMRLAIVGNELLNEILPKWINGNIEPKPQDESNATFTWEKDIDKEKAFVTLDMPTDKVERMIRAFSPWPIAWVKLNIDGKVKRLKIYKASLSKSLVGIGAVVADSQSQDMLGNLAPQEAGKIFKYNKSLYLKFDDGGILELQEIQLEGKKVLPSKEYLFLDGVKIVDTMVDNLDDSK